MEFLVRDGAGGSGDTARRIAHPIESSTPERVETVLRSLEDPGSVSLLLGGGGCGKRRLAQEAAEAFETRFGQPVSIIEMSPPSNPDSGVATHFGYHFPEILGGLDSHDNRDHLVIDDPDEVGARLLSIIDREAGRGTPLLIAPAVDQYSPGATMLLDRLLQSRKCRIVATARRLSGAAAHISRNPRVRRIPVPPLTVEEARAFLLRMLGGEQIELQTLRRWYRLTEGNPLALTLLALALDGHGLLGRDRGVVFELPGAERIPTELGEYLRTICSEEELRTLELIARVEPVFENSLLQMLDPEHLSRLHDRGLLVLSPGPSGDAAVGIRHRIVASAVREQMPPDRVAEVSNEIFDALRAELGGEDPRRSPRLLFRMVAMSLDADRSAPLSWLWDALEILRSGHEDELRLRVALAIAAHPDASTMQLATAAAEACTIARLIGDRERLAEAIGCVRAAEQRLRTSSGGRPMLRVKQQLALVEHLVLDLEDEDGAVRLLDGLEREFSESEAIVREAVRCARAVALASVGRLREAAEYAPQPGEFDSMRIEWQRSQARAVSSLILAQRGRYADAIREAEHTAALASMGHRPQLDTADLLRFCAFIGFWASGSVESARVALQEYTESSFSDTYYSGLADVAAMCMSLADGKWRLAVQRAERLRARLDGHDRQGLGSFVNAGLALALAALGERTESRRAIRRAETRQYGISQALAGCLRLLTIRARLCNGDDDVAELSLRLAGWARTQGLDAIELHALHLLAAHDPGRAEVYRGRAGALAAVVEDPLGGVLLEHIEEMLDGRNAWDSPAARRLTEFGTWMPLPQTDELSAREREIALFASLGYSSRWIAEQFHLSVRTVDTHLRHVFTKIQVSGRDELRHWFRREHAPG